MDILRKEINSVYLAQHLELETLDTRMVDEARLTAETIAKVSGGCAVVTDASCDRSYLYAGPLGPLCGLSCIPGICQAIGSSDEDELYNRLHPEDLAEKRMLEYEFFKLADRLPPEEKTEVRATCRLRIKGNDGYYRTIDNSTRLIRLSPRGKMWLILCIYDLSPFQPECDGIAPRIVNSRTGEVTPVSLAEKRGHLLSDREKQILLLVKEGKPSKKIADELGISIHTVNRHRQNIIQKLSVGNSVEALMAADAMKLL